MAVSTILPAPKAAPPAPQDAEVAGLLDYARSATLQGVSLAREPARQQLLMEAYINSRLTRLFRTRDAWMAATGKPLTYHAAQTRLWERRTALRLSEIAREVVGVYALLDPQDPRAPAQGNFEYQQRRSLAEYGPTGAVEEDAGVIARSLGLGSATPI